MILDVSYNFNTLLKTFHPPLLLQAATPIHTEIMSPFPLMTTQKVFQATTQAIQEWFTIYELQDLTPKYLYAWIIMAACCKNTSGVKHLQLHNMPMFIFFLLEIYINTKQIVSTYVEESSIQTVEREFSNVRDHLKSVAYDIQKSNVTFTLLFEYLNNNDTICRLYKMADLGDLIIMKEPVHSISHKFNSRALFKSQLLTLKENIILFNDTLRLYGELEIDRNVLNSQINEFEEKQRDIKQLLFLNTEVCTTGNSLLEFMRNFSVFIPCMLNEYVKSVLSSFDSSSTHHTTVEITLEQLTTKCSYIRRELSLFSQDVFEFISFFSTNNNLLFLSLLGQITAHRVSQLSPASEMHLDIKQFVQCVHETYQHMHSMCIGDCTYSQVQTGPLRQIMGPGEDLIWGSCIFTCISLLP